MPTRSALVRLLFLAGLAASSAYKPAAPQARRTRRNVLTAATAACSAGLLGASSVQAAAPKFFATPGGVKYFDLKEGSCAPFTTCTPQAGELVVIEYKSYLSNGRMFDSSDGPGRKPLVAKYGAKQLLPGWEEALENMKVGGTRVIEVPPKLGYGDKGVKIERKDGETEYLVPPNEKLQFELTLVKTALPPP